MLAYCASHEWLTRSNRFSQTTLVFWVFNLNPRPTLVVFTQHWMPHILPPFICVHFSNLLSTFQWTYLLIAVGFHLLWGIFHFQLALSIMEFHVRVWNPYGGQDFIDLEEGHYPKHKANWLPPPSTTLTPLKSRVGFVS